MRERETSRERHTRYACTCTYKYTYTHAPWRQPHASEAHCVVVSVQRHAAQAHLARFNVGLQQQHVPVGAGLVVLVVLVERRLARVPEKETERGGETYIHIYIDVYEYIYVLAHERAAPVQS